jgi:hypothetical protein
MADRWGVDVNAQLQDWWSSTYLPGHFFPTHGSTARILVEIYDSTVPFREWKLDNPPILHFLEAGDVDHDDPEGLAANVRGKFRITMRLGIDSKDSSGFGTRLDLLEPGDFPHKGAGEHRNYCGGASGLDTGTKDWDVFTDVVDYLIILRSAAAAPAVAASRARLPGWKYLRGEGVPPPIPTE